MTADINSNRSDAALGGPAGHAERRLRDRLFAIAWAISVAGATFGWLYFLERAIAYSLNWLY